MKRLLVASIAVVSLAVGGPAEDLASRLESATVTLPDGREVAVVGEEDGLLTADELATCLATVDEAGAWPVTWLVVQREGEPFDLLMRLERDDAGDVSAGFAFANPRRDWQPGDVKSIARERLGRKPPRAGLYSLVIQGFSERTVVTYRYRVRSSDKGLAALLAPGALIREAKSLDLDDGAPHTLALVIEQATFRPGDCSSCGAEIFGHADSGEVSLVLTDGKSLLDTLDLTPLLTGLDGPPLVPRFDCDPGDRPDASWSELSSRQPVTLLRPEDRDGDGRALEVALPASVTDCEAWAELVVAVDPATRRLRVVERVSRPF